MRNCEISKEMSSLYFGLATFGLLEARLPEFDSQHHNPNSCGLFSVHCMLYTASNSGTLNFELAEYIKPKIQWRHILSHLRIPHLCCTCYSMDLKKIANVGFSGNPNMFSLFFSRKINEWFIFKIASGVGLIRNGVFNFSRNTIIASCWMWLSRLSQPFSPER